MTTVDRAPDPSRNPSPNPSTEPPPDASVDRPGGAPDAAGLAARPPLEAQRVVNRDRLRDELGLDPYGGRVDGLMTLAEAHTAYDANADEVNKASVQARKDAKKASPDAEEADLPALVDRRPIVRVAGRVILRRDNGKLVWLNIRDHTRELFQVAVSKRDCDDAGFQTAKIGDLGDIVVAEGPLTMTKAGEVTCWASTLRPMSKCLTPPPEKHKGLHDPEIRFRQRALDLWATPHATRALQLRAELIREVRSYFNDAGFVELDTPVLQPLAGGAAARPFVTRMNALDIDLYLRIAPELYLKRLLVGGLPRVFEISRNFRNEGVDRSHNPEFTSVEVYQAYGDYESMAEHTETLIRRMARIATQRRAGEEGVDADRVIVRYGELDIDYGSPFVRVTYAELFERALGFPMTDADRVRDEARARGVPTAAEDGTELDALLVVNELFEEVAEKAIDPARPTFVFDYPAALSPLTKPKAGTDVDGGDDPIPLAERWDIFIGGMEIGPAYTELNDPDVQEAKFREQLAGLDDEETTFRTFDQDFIDALKVGMPPAGGLGLGVDRLVMLMSGHDSIREVLPFPLMKPRDVRAIAVELVGQYHGTLDTASLIATVRTRGVLGEVSDEQLRTHVGVLVEKGELERDDASGTLSLPGAEADADGA